MTKRASRALSGGLLAAALLAGCGGSSNDKPAQTGDRIATTTTEAPEETTTTFAAPPPEAPTTTVVGTGARQADGAAEADRTVTITDGAFEPSSLQVGIDELVTFQSGDNTAYSVTVDDLRAVTVTRTLVESFVFTQPGTVTVTVDGSDEEMTITIAGGAAAPEGEGQAPETSEAPATTQAAESAGGTATTTAP